MRPARIAILIATLGVTQAQAGLFDDDEARRQINDHRIKTEARIDQQGKAQLDLANQLQRQSEEIARLRGQAKERHRRRHHIADPQAGIRRSSQRSGRRGQQKGEEQQPRLGLQLACGKQQEFVPDIVRNMRVYEPPNCCPQPAHGGMITGQD